MTRRNMTMPECEAEDNRTALLTAVSRLINRAIPPGTTPLQLKCLLKMINVNGDEDKARELLDYYQMHGGKS